MKKILLGLLVTYSLSASAWVCDDEHGSTVEVVEDNRAIYGSYLDSLIILKGPIVDKLFGDAQYLNTRYASDGRISRFHINREENSLEIMSRGNSAYYSYVCGQNETCVEVKADHTGVKLFRFSGSESLTSQGHWYFGSCD